MEQTSNEPTPTPGSNSFRLVASLAAWKAAGSPCLSPTKRTTGERGTVRLPSTGSRTTFEPAIDGSRNDGA